MSRGLLLIKEELKNSLSGLEFEILGVLQKRKGRSKEIFEILQMNRQYKFIAPTTVTVLLDRLYKKGLTDRAIESCRGGYRYVYWLKKDPSQFEKNLVEKSVNKLIQRFGPTAVAYFNERFGRG